MKTKIISLHELSRIISDMPERPVVVFTTGVFDVPHVGHPRYLKEAMGFGNLLVVGVHSDELVKQRKGKDRPIYSLAERMEFLSYYYSVNYILELKDQENVYFTIRQLRPDILVVSETTKDTENSPETMTNLFNGYSKVVVLESRSDWHSTDVIKKTVQN